MGRRCEEIRADLTRSSLAIRGYAGLIRLPADNVRLVCDPHMQPGILSIETRDVGGNEGGGGGGGVVGYENYGNANRYGNIHGSDMIRPPSSSFASSLGKNKNNGNGEDDDDGREKNGKKKRRQTNGNGRHGNVRRHPSNEFLSRDRQRSELAYVLTVDERIYRRVATEMGDRHRMPCGMYYCCHGDTDGHSGDHVGIGVAVAILLVVLTFFVAGMIAWPTW